MAFPWEQGPAGIELLREPAGSERLAEELVTLAFQPNGDLVLQAVAVGIGVERFESEGRNKRVVRYVVGAPQVPRVLSAALRDLFGDATALRGWMASRGLEAVADQWHGYGVGPRNEERLLLEALRDVIGRDEPFDEGEKIGYRFGRWLTRHGINYEFREEAGEGY
jgi:hypothetical protein